VVGDYSFRVSEWTPTLDLAADKDTCKLVRIKAEEDPFGCSAAKEVYKFSPAVNRILTENGRVDREVRNNRSDDFYSSFSLSLIFQFFCRSKAAPPSLPRLF
jgi:hypothetical protein